MEEYHIELTKIRCYNVLHKDNRCVATSGNEAAEGRFYYGSFTE